MNQFLELSKKRRSIRKFTEKQIPRQDIEYFISCAVNAPSGCNSQCWHFVAVDNKALILKIADEAADSAREFYSDGTVSTTEEFLASREKAVSYFKGAPLVIFVFLDRMEYHDSRVTKAFTDKGYSHREQLDKLGYPDILSVGAAVQNMLLAITEKGYGACWMNDPVVGEERIKKLLSVKDSLKLLSVIPVGEPSYSPRTKNLKPFEDILEYR